jgi:hypothetical protein
MHDLQEEIDSRIGEIRTDTLDISLGEILNLYQEKEFDIAPDFQRLFRWDWTQRSRLIESVLIEVPIPQIFVIEREDGVLELIDGLQRISSALQFIDSEVIDEPPLELQGCDLVPALNGLKFIDLPASLRLRLKRSTVRAIVIKKQSKTFLRYAMFKRLNTGGTELSDQEIRNCTSRMIGHRGVAFYEFLRECSQNTDYKKCIETLPESSCEKLTNEELVLRFLCLKNAREQFKKNVRDWLDDYMESVIFDKVEFDFVAEEAAFNRLFAFLNRVMGTASFVRFRDDRPVGALAPAHFEAVSLGVWLNIDALEKVDPEGCNQLQAAVVR